jgi:hypothetical protein
MFEGRGERGEGEGDLGGLTERGVGSDKFWERGEAEEDEDVGGRKGSSSSVMKIRPVESAEMSRPDWTNRSKRERDE